MSPAPIELEARPRPLAEAARDVAWWLGLLAFLVTGGTSFGLITAQQGDAVTGLLGLIPGLITAVMTVLSAFGVVRRGEPLVTPLSDPRDAQLRVLVAQDPTGRSNRP